MLSFSHDLLHKRIKANKPPSKIISYKTLALLLHAAIHLLTFYLNFPYTHTKNSCTKSTDLNNYT